MQALLSSLFAVANLTGASPTQLPEPSIAPVTPVETGQSPIPPTDLIVVYDEDRSNDLTILSVGSYGGCVSNLAKETRNISAILNEKSFTLFGTCMEHGGQYRTELQCTIEDNTAPKCKRVPDGTIQRTFHLPVVSGP